MLPATTPRILVCFAVPQEAAPLRHHQVPGLHWLVTGMGRRNAWEALTAALRRERPSVVLTCGFAGGLRPDLQAGQVVFDADPDSPLDEALTQTNAVRVRFHCADRVAITALEKARLRQETNADAVEMESSVIRQLCATQGIAAATVRVISDTADENLPLDFNRLMTDDQNLHWGRFAIALLRRPAAMPGLMRMQRQCALAAHHLTQVILEVARHPALSTSH